jgi:hypothetical protein
MADLVSAKDLGIDTNTDQGLFDWFLASMLFGRPVPQSTAVSSWHRLQDDGWTTAEHYLGEDYHPLWHELWIGNYHRMGSVMTEELRAVMGKLVSDYAGSVGNLVRSAISRENLSVRVQEFKGIGPKTAEIFLREVPDSAIAANAG